MDKKVENSVSLVSRLKLYGAVLVLVVVSEYIGVLKFQLGPGNVILFPMLYALILGAFLSLKRWRLFSDSQRKIAETLLGIALFLFVSKLGTMLGPSLPKLAHLGWGFVLQEVGHFLGTVVLGLPFAVLLRMGRESIGATFSIDREPNLAILVEKFGVDSPELRGALGVYVCGTLFGALYIAVLAGWLGATGWFNPLALAMGTGVGSGSMMAAGSGALAASFPEKANDIAAVAALSNLMTTIIGPYVGIFITLPLTTLLYNWFVHRFRLGNL